ncbi:reticulon-4 receptor-like 2 [Cydia pomonella]|uniref:reticulon-4 receptor-like 2 n=1 Tax=Cydia pomonella TaxID=82600 RepID=UPI002ADD536D|nr:reticulon-4 receptor-like 2 [Cydia pomonella]
MESLKKLLLLSVLATAEADFTANCPLICKCSWAAGNKKAACSNVDLHDLPKTLSTEIQILDLSNNSLHEIKQRAFEDAQLINLKKLFLRDCELQTIHKHGLKGLAIMIQLDLSKNNLKELHPDTFKEITNIRWMLLNDNQLETLDDGLFNNLPILQKVDLNNNKIKQIGVRTFFNVPRLSNLKLDHNLLESLNIDTLSALTALTSLDIHGNPWKCDCLLQPLKKLVTSKNLCTTPVACTTPDIVQGKLWNELNTPDFACPPNIVYPATGITIHTYTS